MDVSERVRPAVLAPRHARNRRENHPWCPAIKDENRCQPGDSDSTSCADSSLDRSPGGGALLLEGHARSRAGSATSCMASPMKTPMAEKSPNSRMGAKSLYHR